MAKRSGNRAYDPRKSQVNFLTVQSSEGFEFRSVIFIGVGQIESSETQTAQNMKLLYVGMTRAKERLLITASGRNEFTEILGTIMEALCAAQGNKALVLALCESKTPRVKFPWKHFSQAFSYTIF